MEGLIEGPFAAALERHRNGLNARFSAAQAAASHIDASAFSGHLARVVRPIVDAAARIDPSSADRVTLDLFAVSLELFGADLLGPRARHPEIPAAWKDLLPGLAPLLSRSPRRVAGAASNALFRLAGLPGGRPAEWTRTLVAAASRIEDVDSFFAAGRVAAWRAGLATERERALNACRTMAPPLAAMVLGAGRELDAAGLASVLDALAADPWLDPAQAGRPAATKRLVLAGRVGGFRGFGGPFVAPPSVALSGGQLIVRDGDAVFWLTADRFGATLSPAGAGAAAGSRAETEPFAIARGGRVRRGELTATLPELAEAAGSASDGATLAVTLPYSHSVYLVAIVAGP